MGSLQKTRVLLIGTGGVGAMAAYALETGGCAEVTAVCRSNYAAVTQKGFSIDSLEHGRDIHAFRPTHVLDAVPSASRPDNRFEYLVVSTKNIPDVSPTTLDVIAPAVTPGYTTIVLLQNGLNIEKTFVAGFPSNAILSGISMIAATETSPGVVTHTDPDEVKLGPFPHQALPAERLEKAARDFIDLYMACGRVRWTYDADVRWSRWKKLVYNSSFNSVSAVLGLDTPRMRMSRTVIDDLIRPLMLEIVAIARGVGVELPEGIDDVLIRVDGTEFPFLPSMGQDAKKASRPCGGRLERSANTRQGNYIEFENIVGEPLREAERAGVPAPTLRTIYGLLKAKQLMTKEARGLWTPRFEEDNPYA